MLEIAHHTLVPSHLQGCELWVNYYKWSHYLQVFSTIPGGFLAVFSGNHQRRMSSWWPMVAHPQLGVLRKGFPLKEPFKGHIPNKYPLYKVYMGLIIKGPPSQGYHHFPYDSGKLTWRNKNGGGWFRFDFPVHFRVDLQLNQLLVFWDT